MSSIAEVRRGGRRRSRSIAWPIFALVIVAVCVAAAAFFVITFSGPPFDPPRGIGTVAATLRTGREPSWREPGRGPDGPGERHPLRFAIETAPPAPGGGLRPDPAMRGALAASLGAPIADVVVLTGRDQRRAAPDAFFADYAAALRSGERWRVVRNPQRPFFRRWHVVTLGSMLGAVLVLSIPAWALSRAISRPLRALARTAAAARAGAPLPPIAPSRTREVAELGEAIGAMHARLAGHAQGRTAMLAAIAHDLGTPLSRLAFRTEQLPEASRLRAAQDIEEMRAMIAAALAFARDELSPVAGQRVDLGSLLDSLVDDMADAGAPVTVERGARAVVRGDAGALRRLFANLAENAVRYGARAAIGWSIGGGTVRVTVEDEGPGIDPATIEQLFEPFVRGDPSRNRATGGTGLGLAIVRSIARRHGGEAVLENGATGARAIVTLPLAG